jgi:hypothetical protein
LLRKSLRAGGDLCLKQDYRNMMELSEWRSNSGMKEALVGVVANWLFENQEISSIGVQDELKARAKDAILT